MSDTLHSEHIYDNLQRSYTNSSGSDNNNNNNSCSNNNDNVSDTGEKLEIDNELEVVLRDRKYSVEIQQNRSRHKKFRSWNQNKLKEINNRYFNSDETSDNDKENANGTTEKKRRSKSVGFVLATDINSDDSYETADEMGSDHEFNIEKIRTSFTAQVQNHYYTPSLSTTATSQFGNRTSGVEPPANCTANEKSCKTMSSTSDDPEYYSDTDTDNEFLAKKKIGWNPPSPPPLPPLPPEINLPNASSPEPKVDVSSFLQKKSMAQGMMDIALLSANTNQLRYVLDSRYTHPYFTASMTLICFSLFLQILVGLSLIWNSQYNVRRRSELKTADRLNNISVVGVFLISVTNVFISTFGGSTNTLADDVFTPEPSTNGNVSLIENLE